MLRSGILAVPFHVGFGPFGKFMGANTVMEGIHKEHVPEPHWGSHTPCYRETSEERNIPFYEQKGFVVLQSAALGKGGPTGWAMRREPRSSG